MTSKILFIKNMVCYRCVLAVETILHTEDIPFKKVHIGEIHLTGELTEDQKTRLIESLTKIEFKLIDSYSQSVIEKIKHLLIKRARNEVNSEECKVKLSHYISAFVNHEYSYLSSLFSSIEGRSIENYFIEQRIEKVKELLKYGELTLSQIAYELDYSSVAHLSAQFKKVTGFTPSVFKVVCIENRV